MLVRVIGCGAMGTGIAQVLAQAGCTVSLYDASPTAVTAAREKISQIFSTLVERGRMTAAQREAALACVIAIDEECSPGFAPDMVIEAIVEDLHEKQQLFCRIQQAFPEAICATNTSSLSVTEIASATHHPHNVVGLHFFNPVPLMKIAEVIPGIATSQRATDAALSLVEKIGHQAVLAPDTPGFLVNHVGRGLPTEALALLETRVMEPESVDSLVRDVIGLKMGPCELMDLTGLDVSHKVLHTVWEGFQYEPRLRPSFLTAPRVQAGLLGRKTGKGWFTYPRPHTEREQNVDVPRLKVAICGAEDEPEQFRGAVARLRDMIVAVGHQLVSAAESDLVVVTPWGRSVAATARACSIDPQRCVGIDALSLLLHSRPAGISIIVGEFTDPVLNNRAATLVHSLGCSVTTATDEWAPPAQRILYSMVNTACGVAQISGVKPADIDLACRLALGYPRGPLELGDSVGVELVVLLGRRLTDETADPRYRSCGWLVHRAMTGKKLFNNE